MYTLKKGIISKDVIYSDNGTVVIQAKLCAHVGVRFK